MAIKLADTLKPMGDFPIAEAQDIAFEDGETLQQKLDEEKLGGSENIISYSNPSQLGLSSTCSTLDILNKMQELARSKSPKAITGAFNNNNKSISDAPDNYGILTVTCINTDKATIQYAGVGSSDSTGTYIGKYTGTSGVYDTIKWVRYDDLPPRSRTLQTYFSISDLNNTKGTSITLAHGTDATAEVFATMGAKEEFIEWYGNGGGSRWGIDADLYGGRIDYIRIIKWDTSNGFAVAYMDTGKIMTRSFQSSGMSDWICNEEKASSDELPIIAPSSSGAASAVIIGQTKNGNLVKRRLYTIYDPSSSTYTTHDYPDDMWSPFIGGIVSMVGGFDVTDANGNKIGYVPWPSVGGEGAKIILENRSSSSVKNGQFRITHTDGQKVSMSGSITLTYVSEEMASSLTT